VDDIDILSIMKEIPTLKSEFKIYYDQIFNREHYVPLWKTKIAFDQKIKESVSFRENVPNVIARADDPIYNVEPKILSLLKSKGSTLELGEFYIFNREFKLAFPDFEEKIYFYIPGGTPPFQKYSELFSSAGTIPLSDIQEKMFFVFLSNKKIKEKENLINLLNTQNIS
jgi:hypothetical protein